MAKEECKKRLLIHYITIRVFKFIKNKIYKWNFLKSTMKAFKEVVI